MALFNPPGSTRPIESINVIKVQGELAIDSSDTELFISPIGGAEPTFPSDTGELIKVKSDNAADTGTVTLQGLDTSYHRVEEQVTLQGLTAVTTQTKFTRVNRISWDEENGIPSAGNIKATDLTETKVYRFRTQGRVQQDLSASYSVSTKNSWFVDDLYAAIVRDNNSQAIATVRIYYRPIGGYFRQVFNTALATRGTSNIFYKEWLPELAPGAGDVYMTVNSSDINVEISARLSIYERAGI